VMSRRFHDSLRAEPVGGAVPDLVRHRSASLRHVVQPRFSARLFPSPAQRGVAAEAVKPAVAAGRPPAGQREPEHCSTGQPQEEPAAAPPQLRASRGPEEPEAKHAYQCLQQRCCHTIFALLWPKPTAMKACHPRRARPRNLPRTSLEGSASPDSGHILPE
jgi:hypothetical protein